MQQMPLLVNGFSKCLFFAFLPISCRSGGVLAVKVVSLKHLMGDSHEAALRREALVLELAAMQDYTHPNLLTMQVC